MIDTFLTTYEDRKKELRDFFNLLEFLEKKENAKDESGFSEFEKIFHNGENRISFTYQQLINILKSNASLMIYSIIEFTVANLVESIYDEIKVQKLSYIDVSDSIKKLWSESALKSATDPNASFNTFFKKHEEVVQDILCCHIAKITAKQTLPAGNLDGKTIKDTFAAHGITVFTQSENYRPDLLRIIKDNRNNLAHGSVSFVEALQMQSIADIKGNATTIIFFLDELIVLVKEYIEQQKYRVNEKSY